MLDLSRACWVDNLCCWQCTFYVLTPTHLTNACRLFDCISSFICSPYCHMVLNADERVHSVTCVRLFLPFFLTQDFTLFHICASLFSPSFPFFYRTFPLSHLYPHFFHRPQLNYFARFIRRDHLLVCISFHSS